MRQESHRKPEKNTEVQRISFVGYTGGVDGGPGLWNLQILHAVLYLRKIKYFIKKESVKAFPIGNWLFGPLNRSEKGFSPHNNAKSSQPCFIRQGLASVCYSAV